MNTLTTRQWVEKHIGQPRSIEYRNGLGHYYNRRSSGFKNMPFDMPYKVGTVQADAFLAGYYAGEIFYNAENDN